jgi:hypothetical protein
LPKAHRKKFFCTVVSEVVQIALKNRYSLGFESRSERFVQCNQLECQYVDLNQPPCPLSPDLFAEVIEREEKSSDKAQWEPQINGSLLVRPIGS